MSGEGRGRTTDVSPVNSNGRAGGRVESSFAVLLAMVATGFLYSPLSVWSAHVGEASFLRLVVIGSSGAMIGSALLWLTPTSKRGELTAFLVPLALVFSISGRWQPFGNPAYSKWWVAVSLGAVFVGWLLLRVLLRSDLHSIVAVVVIATFGIAPLGSGLLRLFDELSTTDVRRGTTLSSNRVGPGPDVILVILDGYASSDTLQRQFGFDDAPFQVALEEAGFSVFHGARANYTMSHLSIASLLEMEYVVDDETLVGPAEIDRLYASIRGDNAFVHSLKSAGYKYVHWESGWTGSRCGPEVDECLRGILDEESWAVLTGTAVGPLLNKRFGSGFAQNALRQLRRLPEEARRLLDDGAPTLLIVHIIAPHPPVVLESDCEVSQEVRVISNVIATPGHEMDPIDRIRYAEQVECVNALVQPFLDEIRSRDDVLVIITGDHGTDSLGQPLLHYSAWTNEHFEERVGILHAIKGPSCSHQGEGNVVLVNSLRGVLRCALDVDAEELPPRFFITPPINVRPPTPVVEVVADHGGRWVRSGP